MRRQPVPRLPAVLTLLLALAACLASAADAQTIDITPRPLDAEIRTGASLTLGDGVPIVTARGDVGAQRVALYLASLAEKSRGLKFRVTSGRQPRPIAVALERGAGPADTEGYTLDVSKDGVRIVSSSDAGLFYGAVSLWQLMTADGGTGAVTLAPMHIVRRAPLRLSRPAAGLGAAFPVAGLRRADDRLDGAAQAQPAAMAPDRRPGLAHPDPQVSAADQRRRLARAARPGDRRAEALWRLLYPAQIRRIVAYAAARHVTIEPEIEMPGHSLSAILAYPWLGAAKADPRTQSDWGVFPDILDPNERTYAFMTDVLGEVMALFPGPWINVGGDEAVKDDWKASPRIQAQIKRLGLANEDALQGWFTARVGKFIAAHGRRMIAGTTSWSAATPCRPDAATVSWHQDGVLRATRAGHDTLMALAPTYYLDNRQSDLASEPTGRGWITRLAEVYAIDPTPPSMTASDVAHIIGVQANLWTEHMPTEAVVAKMAFPRAAALAETGWTTPARKDWDDFQARLPAELTRYHALGLDPDTGAVGVKLTQQRANGTLTVSLASQLGEIRYTVDGAAPALSSPLYQAPIPVSASTRIRAATFIDGREISPELDRRIDPAGPERRASQELSLCSNGVSLNLAGQNAAQPGPYLVDIMNPCWIWPQADLAHFSQLRWRWPACRSTSRSAPTRPRSCCIRNDAIRRAGSAGRRLHRRPDRAALAGAGAEEQRRRHHRRQAAAPGRIARPLLQLHPAQARSDVGDRLGGAGAQRRPGGDCAMTDT